MISPAAKMILLMSKRKPPAQVLDQGRSIVNLVMQGLIIPDGHNAEGTLIKSYGTAMLEVVRWLAKDWNEAFKIPAEKWEELYAAAYSKEGYKVTITPRSGDFGRDVIAEKTGRGSIRLLGSMKAYAPDHLVDAAHVREMLGVITADPKATKGIIATTSNFAPRLMDDKRLSEFIPYRLELMNGEALKAWLTELANLDEST